MDSSAESQAPPGNGQTNQRRTADGSPPTSNASPVMHLMQPVNQDGIPVSQMHQIAASAVPSQAAPGHGEGQAVHYMQPPMSMPLMMGQYPMMVPAQVFAQSSQSPGPQAPQSGSPAAQGSPAGNSRSNTPGQLQQHIPPTSVAYNQPQQPGSADGNSSNAHGTGSPHTPGSLGSPHMLGDGGHQQMPGMPFSQHQLPPGFPVGFSLPPQQLQQLHQQAQHQSPQEAHKPPPEIKPEKPDLKNLKPPKKPLTPYMRFSKSIWQQVKAANQTMSVCEIGATIGRMWRELGDAEKQKYNEDFTRAKGQYDEDLQHYLKITGLQASDLVKPKGKKREAKEKQQQAHHQQANAHHHQSQPQVPQQFPMGLPGMPGQINGPMQMGLPFQHAPNSSQALANAMGGLPHFSQVWAGQQPPQYGNQQVNQMMASQLTMQMQQQGHQVYSNGNNVEGSNAGGNQQTVPQIIPQEGSAAPVYREGGQEDQTNSQEQAQQPQADANMAHSEGHVGGSPTTSNGVPMQGNWSWHQPGNNGQQLPEEMAAAGSKDIHGSDKGGDAKDSELNRERSASDLKTEPAPNGPVSSAQYQGSAHNLFNSYAPNPWSAYPIHGQGAAPTPIESLSKAQQSEMQHLRNALSEKTKEVQRLTQDLDKAFSVIESLKHSLQQSQHLPSQQSQLQSQSLENSEQQSPGRPEDSK